MGIFPGLRSQMVCWTMLFRKLSVMTGVGCGLDRIAEFSKSGKRTLRAWLAVALQLFGRFLMDATRDCQVCRRISGIRPAPFADGMVVYGCRCGPGLPWSRLPICGKMQR